MGGADLAELAGEVGPVARPARSGPPTQGEAAAGDARWRKRLALLADGCRRLGTDALDLVILEDAPTPLGHRVLKRGRLVGDTQPRRRAAVAERILRQYLDEGYLRRVLDAGLAERLRERRFAR